jgi:hypothetical protein
MATSSRLFPLPSSKIIFTPKLDKQKGRIALPDFDKFLNYIDCLKERAGCGFGRDIPDFHEIGNHRSILPLKWGAASITEMIKGGLGIFPEPVLTPLNSFPV